MAILKTNRTGLKEILTVIPENILSELSITTRVDYCTKVLYGKHLFYLLLYGLLKLDKVNQRSLADLFSSPFFRTLFNIEGERRLSHSSLSDRLSVIKVDYFRQIYESIYQFMSNLYSEEEISGFRLQRVDSTVVTETTKKIEAGLHCGYTKLSNKKMVKFSVSFDGLFPSSSNMHTEERYASENNSLPEQIYKVVSNNCRKSDGKEDLFIFDRGVCSAEKFCFLSEDKVLFVGRLQYNRSFFVVKDLLDDTVCREFSDGSVLLEDKIVHLYKKETVLGKSGKEVNKKVRVEKDLRIVIIQPFGKNEKIIFVTNHFLLPAKDIASIYRKRWDIEVFFRFIKQELNFSNFISLNSNGIEVVMYVTLIAAMLIVIYKKLNNVGYQTAKRRIGLDLERLIGAILVLKSGGDLKKVGLDDP